MVRLKVLGERSGKDARVSAGFRVVWEGGLAGGRLGGMFTEGRKRTFPGLLSLFYHVFMFFFIMFLSFFLSFFYSCFCIILLSLLIISRIAQDFGDHFSIISRMVRIPELIFSHSQKGRGFGDHSYISLPEWSRIRNIEHAQAAKTSGLTSFITSSTTSTTRGSEDLGDPDQR